MNTSATPQTDAAIQKQELDNYGGFPIEFEYVDPEFARELERELSELRVKMAFLREKADADARQLRLTQDALHRANQQLLRLSKT